MAACRILTLKNEDEWIDLSLWLEKRAESTTEVESVVRGYIDDVRKRGDDALLDYTRQFDCMDFLPPLRVAEAERVRAGAAVHSENREAIFKAADNIRRFHENQVEKSWFTTSSDGTFLGQKVTPVDSVGIYVPGGRGGITPLVSSLLMCAIPALVAGVKRVAIITPPRPDGSVNSHILVAAHLLNIEEVYRIGGAWGIAALAYGTQSIPAVDVIVGPGNIYVTTAKKLVQGHVGIDAIAGPSEIVILADTSARPAWVAADMLAQAEHDVLASAICITDDARFASQIERELESQCQELSRSGIASKSLEDWGGIIVVPNITTGINIVNHLASEHLELCVRDPWTILPHIRHAGAIFMGNYCPEATGDYFAGPNHVLPTMGSARFSSALSVQTFYTKSSIIGTTQAFMKHNADDIARLARIEGLEAHARSVEYRYRR